MKLYFRQLFFQMPMELAEKINQIDDLNEFLHEFVDQNSLDNVTFSGGHPRDTSRRREFDFKRFYSLFFT